MKRLLISSILFAIGLRVAAQLPPEALKPIPENVRKNALVVKRYENIKLEVKSLSKATYSVHQVFTIMGERGKQALQFVEYTSKFVSLDEVEIKVYDANGKQINKYKKKDLSTTIVGDDLIDDVHYYYFNIPAPSYPVTVEYKFERSYNGILNYPSYDIGGSAEGVMFSSYTAKVPRELGLRYKEKNIKLAPTITQEGNTDLYTWTVKDMAPLEYEEGFLSRNAFPYIMLGPNRFRVDDFEGDLSSWKNFGLWYNSILTGTDKMSEEKKAFYKDMVKNADSDYEKVRIIYSYLQQNFRYVSIQLGIGGWRPFPADFTDIKKYGDCKGLSNYVHNILKALGIRSHLALTNMDGLDEPIDKDFPLIHFNHMILCVPQAKDTLWLECTSKTRPFTLLDVSTSNRNSLLITEDGGVLVKTPRCKASDNTVHIRTTVLLSEDGSGSSSSDIEASGEYSAEFSHYLYDEKKDDQKQYLVRQLGFKQPDEFKISKVPGQPDFSSKLDLKIEKIPEFTAGSKMFLAPYVYKFWAHQLPKSDNRKYDFYFGCPFQKTDTTVYKLPAGYIVEAIPESKKFSCELGSYSSRYWFDEKEGSVYSTTTLVLQDQKIPASKYAEVKSFFDNVLKEGSQRIVIKKN